MRRGDTQAALETSSESRAIAPSAVGPAPPAAPVRSKERFLVFGSPQIEEAEIDEVVASMRACWLGKGPKVSRFEEAFRAHQEARHAVAVSSCTAALHLSMLALGVGPGDEVITTPMTFCATVNAILHAGATPVLADVDPHTMNIRPELIEAAVTPRTRAILPVHFAGRACEMDPIMEIAARHGLLVIEDCAHAIETRYRGQSAGTFGDAGCFSFYVTKNLTTGEGGMVTSPHESVAAAIKTLSLHGMSQNAWQRFSDEGFRHYAVESLGYKFNMTDMQASLGLHQLDRVEANWERRRAVWAAYNEGLADLPIDLPPDPEPDTRHAFHLYTILIDEERTGVGRDRFLDRMTAQGIGVGVHYLSIPEHPYYQRQLGWRPDMAPTASEIGRRTVSIPLSAKLTEADVADVIEAVRRCLAQQEAKR